MQPARWPPHSTLIVAMLTLAGAALRLYGLGNRSLWVDELLAAQTNQLPSLWQVLATTPLDHMPLDLVLSWLFRFAGDSESALRLPSVFAGTLLVPATYLLARRTFDTATAVIASLLVAISPFAVWYSQEVSPYSLLLLFVTLQAWLAQRAAERARLSDWLLLSLVTSLSLYTHYVAALASIAVYSWIALELGLQARQRLDRRASAARFLGLATSGMLVVLAMTPWLPEIHAFLAAGAAPQASKYLVAGRPFDNLASQLDALGIGWLMAAIAMVGIWSACRRRSLILIFSFGIPLLVWTLVLRAGALVVLSRYLAESWPALVILSAAGVTTLAALATRRRQGRARIIAGVLALVLVGEATPTLLRWYGEPKDDWRGAARLIGSRSSPGSPVLAMGSGSDWAAPSIGWYLTRDRRPMLVLDAGGSSSDNRSTTDQMAAQIRGSDGPAFAVIANGHGPQDLRTSGRAQTGVYTTVPAPPPGSIRTDLVGVTVIQAPDALVLLRWGATFVPGVLATDALVENRSPTRMLLPPNGNRGPYQVQATAEPGQEVWSTTATAGEAMVARFQCSASEGADARVYVSAHDFSGGWLALFPGNAGYGCQGGGGAFAFSTPGGTRTVRLWLRVQGRGRADFTSVQLLSVAP
jgi:hypothetical protein